MPLTDTSIMLILVDCLDLPTVLALRYTCGACYRLMNTYQASIIKQLCYRYPNLANKESHLNAPQSFQDLLTYDVCRRLAINAVSSPQWTGVCGGARKGIDADDTFGDDLRYRVTQGFRVAQNLADIRATLEREHESQKISKVKQRDRLKMSTRDYSRIPPKLITAWISYISTLSTTDVTNFAIMGECIRGKLRFTGIFPMCQRQPPLWACINADTESEALEWLVFFLFCQGPRFIMHLWSQTQHHAERCPAHPQLAALSASRKTVQSQVEEFAHFIRSSDRDRTPYIQNRESSFREAFCIYQSHYFFYIDQSDLSHYDYVAIAESLINDTRATTSYEHGLMSREKNRTWRKKYTTSRYSKAMELMRRTKSKCNPHFRTRSKVPHGE